MEYLEDTIKKTKNTKRGNRMYNFKKIEKNGKNIGIITKVLKQLQVVIKNLTIY